MNFLHIGIPKETTLTEKRKLIIINMLTIICVLINIFYFVFLLTMGKFIFSSYNLISGIIIGTIGFYLMKTMKYEAAKIFNLTSIPLVLLVFSLIYGDLGFNLYFILLSISSFIILENKKVIILINI